jgi:NAD(P)-dependent dehydrogenase (short-subunit alcohol dehydrogenase family)
LAHQGKIAFDNLQSEREYKPLYGAYAQSKLADLMFMIELQRRLSAAGSPIISAGAHPGIAVTNLQSNLTGLFKLLGPLLTPIIGQDAAHGALPTLYAATSPDVVPGGYYGPDARTERKGYPAAARIPRSAIDADVAQRLWAEAERLTAVALRPQTL